jgi:hypothetical protein
MPAAALSTSKVVPLAEAWAAKGIGGGKAAERYTVARSHLTSMADQTVARASKLQDDSARGKVIADGLDTFRRNWIKEKNSLYAKAALPEAGMAVEPRQTLALLDSVLADKHSAGSILRSGPIADDSFFTGLYNGLTREVTQPDGTVIRVAREVEARDLLNARRELQAKVASSFSDPFSAANKGTLKKLAATMDEELKTAIRAADPALGTRIDVADAAYKEGLGKINSTFGKSIHKLSKEGKYDKIAQSIANSRMSVDDLPRIMEVAGPEGADGMRAAVLADLVSKAKNTKGELTPDGLGRVMKTFGDDRLAALLTPDQMAKMRDLATLSGSLQKGEKVIGGSQTMFLGRYGSVPAGLWIDPVITLTYIAGDVATNKFIASRVGQRWLTTGFQPFTREATTRGATAAAHAATLPLVQEDPEDWKPQ